MMLPAVVHSDDVSPSTSARIASFGCWALITLAATGIAVAAAINPSGPFAALGLFGLVFVISSLSLTRRDAQTVLTLMLILLFLVPENYVLVGPLRGVGNPALLVALFALVLWSAGRVLGLYTATENHPIRWVLLIYAAAGIASFAAAMSRTLTLSESAGATRALFALAAALGISLLAVDGLRERERVETVLQRLVWLGGIAAFIGILEFAFKGFSYFHAMHLPGLTTTADFSSGGSRGVLQRIQGAAAHPIEYAVTLVALAPLALHYALYADTSRKRQLNAFALLFILVVNPLTVSRSGIVSLAVGLGVYAAHLSFRARSNGVILGVMGIGLYGAAVPGLLGTLRGLFVNSAQDPSITARTEDYARIPGLLNGYELFGRGLGTFQPLSYFVLDNQYLFSLVEGGIVALIALIACCIIGFGVSRGIRHRTADPALRGLGQALAGGLATFAVCAGTFDELGFRQAAFTFFLLLGCAGALWSMVRANPKRRRSGELRTHSPARKPAVE
jgi:hypothetical protein